MNDVANTVAVLRANEQMHKYGDGMRVDSEPLRERPTIPGPTQVRAEARGCKVDDDDELTLP